MPYCGFHMKSPERLNGYMVKRILRTEMLLITSHLDKAEINNKVPMLTLRTVVALTMTSDKTQTHLWL